MRAPPRPNANLFFPVFQSGDLYSRKAFFFGSGNQGAGGRVLVSAGGVILLQNFKSFNGVELGQLGFQTAHPAKETRISRLRVDKATFSSEGAFTGWEAGEVEDRPGGSYTPETKTNLTTNTNETYTMEGASNYGTCTAAEANAAWAQLKSYLNASLSLEPISPSAVRTYLKGSGIDGSTGLGAEDSETRRASCSFSEKGSGAYGSGVSASVSRVRQCGAYIFGYYGRRKSVCDFRIHFSGRIKNAHATVIIYRAGGTPEDYLTEEDEDGVMPPWERVTSFVLTESDNEALGKGGLEPDKYIITCPVPGSTLMLATVSCEAIEATITEDDGTNPFSRSWRSSKSGTASLTLELLPPLKTKAELDEEEKR